MFADKMLCDLMKRSDIERGSPLYEEVARALIDFGLNLALLVFTTSEHSSCARTLDEDTVACPVLTIYLRYNADFQRTGIDRHFGNWDDKWSSTRSIRDALNECLKRHGLGTGYVSNHTFVFVHTLEEVAFRQLGQRSADKVREMVVAKAAGVQVDGVYWNGEGYYCLMRNKVDYKRIKRKVKEAVMNEIPKILASADIDGYCKDYTARIQFGFGGVVPIQFMR